MPAARLKAYKRETVIAEKLEAIVSLGIQNSRMKDYYDLLKTSFESAAGDLPTCRILDPVAPFFVDSVSLLGYTETV